MPERRLDGQVALEKRPSASESEKLARLNGVAIVFEHAADGDGNLTTLLWEWK